MQVYIGIGSNIGNRRQHIFSALREIESHSRIRIERVSSLYETSPVGPRQRWFLNAAARLKTSLSPAMLLRTLKKIERKLGREKAVRRGPRPIDLDILFYGKKRLKTGHLIIPHPEFQKRKFVLVPMKEIAPDFRPPGKSQSIRQILGKLTDSRQKVKLIKTQFHQNCVLTIPNEVEGS